MDNESREHRMRVMENEKAIRYAKWRHAQQNRGDIICYVVCLSLVVAFALAAVFATMFIVNHFAS